MKQLKIYIDRLKNEEIFKVKEALSPDFLQIDEEELAFKDPVILETEAYLADDHLVIHLSVHTIARLPCSICNEEVQAPIHIKNLCSTHPINEIDGAVFDLTEEIRENILLQTPLFIECSEGKCPERDQMKVFLKDNDAANDAPTHNFPFADLN